MEIIKKVLHFCKNDTDHLSKVLNQLGIGSYFSFVKLQDDSFIEQCDKYLLKNNYGAINPGTYVNLKNIGERIASISEEEFIFKFTEVNVKTKKKFPLLEAMTAQTTLTKYPKILKDVSILLRLQAGRHVHQFLSDNLPIPKTSATDKYLKACDFVCEGELLVSYTFK